MKSKEREDFKRKQWLMLKRQIEYCYNNSPFYQNKMKNHDIEPGDIKKPSDFQKFPFTRREEIYLSQQEWPPFGNLVAASQSLWNEVHTTTGAMSQPIYVVWSKKDIRNTIDFVSRSLSRLGVTKEDVIYNVFRYGFRMGGLTVHRASEELGCLVIPVGAEGSANSAFDLLINLNPTVFVSFPSEIFKLKERLELRKINPRNTTLRMAVLGGEPGTSVNQIRGVIESTLDIKVYDTYGITEMGPLIGTECLCQKGLHWAEDYFFVEIIDPVTGKTCVPGQMGILVLSDLSREAMPLLRYWTNDYVIMSESLCECGSIMMRTEGGVLGRETDIVSFKGRKFYLLELQEILWGFEGVPGQEFRLILEGGGPIGPEICFLQLESIYERSSGEEQEYADKVVDLVKNRLGINVSIEYVPYGTLNKYGALSPKVSRIIDRRKPDNMI
jgi:phenylacetate-CoA ligase